MPPVRRFKREDIIDTAYNIVKEEGFESINARRIAKELGCSIQPIFHNFTTMDELNKAVYDKMSDKCREYMFKNSDKEKAYKEMGLGYISFAKDYPEFFKAIFMQKTNLDAESFIMSDFTADDIVRIGQGFTGYDYEEQKKFHVKVWIFTHGIACLLATNTAKFTDEEIEELLVSTVGAMLNAK